MKTIQNSNGTTTVKVEPEYWRDPMSRALATLFFVFGVVATLLTFYGLGSNIVLIILGGLAGLVSLWSLGTFCLYNGGCIWKDEKQKFRNGETDPAFGVIQTV